MSLCRDPVIFLLSEAVKLIEDSPAKILGISSDWPVLEERKKDGQDIGGLCMWQPCFSC